MMPMKNQSELDSILNQFEVPKLKLDRAIEAGPDERLYFLHDEQGHHFGIWARDYMSEPYAEAQNLSMNQNLEVAKWFKIKHAESGKGDGNDYMTYSDGMWYGVFLLQ